MPKIIGLTRYAVSFQLCLLGTGDVLANNVEFVIHREGEG